MIEVLIAILCVLAVIQGVVLFKLRQAEQSVKHQIESAQRHLALQQQSISGLTAGAVGMDRRIKRVEASEKTLTQRQETMENQQVDDMPYGHAIQLVQQGAGTERLIDELSLTQSEAELIVRLHGQQP